MPGSRHTGGINARPAEYERRVVDFFDRALAREVNTLVARTVAKPAQSDPERYARVALWSRTVFETPLSATSPTSSNSTSPMWAPCRAASLTSTSRGRA
jgi:hypothetical protein